MATKTIFITQLTTSSFTVPADFGSLVSIEALGAGGGSDTGGSNKVPGGGGGAYAYSNYSTNLAPGKVLQAYIAPGGEYIAQDPANTTLRDTTGAGFLYVSAASGKGSVNGLLGGDGGLAANCVGSGPKYSGGNGGTSGNTTQFYGKGGGGGAAGPGGVGGNGGNGIGAGYGVQAGGGGGGAGGVSSAGSTGENGIQSSNGGNGGADGNGNAGGLGAVRNTSAATSPVSSSGGGGGAYGDNTYQLAGNGGSTQAVWTSVDGQLASPGGGGGGGLEMGDGGKYGGGAGGGYNNIHEGKGGQGIIVFTYNVAATASSTPYSVGQSGVANYVNTTSSAVTRVVADNGLGSYSPVVIGSGGGGRVDIPVVISANQPNVQVDVVALAGYRTGVSNITITVNAGVYIYATNKTSPAILIYGTNPGDTVTLINNGKIIGYGGNGGLLVSRQCGGCGSPPYIDYVPENGFTAVSTLSNLTITNNGYIGGGGGGGGAGNFSYYSPSGGGGAGGGTGNPYSGTRTPVGTKGANGVEFDIGYCQCWQYPIGGNGGFIIDNPTGGASNGIFAGNASGEGGNAGGAGSSISSGAFITNPGGGTGNAGAVSGSGYAIGGGGGGFGGAGATGFGGGGYSSQVGGVGGYAVNKNGKTVTITGSGPVYGTVVA